MHKQEEKKPTVSSQQYKENHRRIMTDTLAIATLALINIKDGAPEPKAIAIKALEDIQAALKK